MISLTHTKYTMENDFRSVSPVQIKTLSFRFAFNLAAEGLADCECTREHTLIAENTNILPSRYSILHIQHPRNWRDANEKMYHAKGSARHLAKTSNHVPGISVFIFFLWPMASKVCFSLAMPSLGKMYFMQEGYHLSARAFVVPYTPGSRSNPPGRRPCSMIALFTSDTYQVHCCVS